MILLLALALLNADDPLTTLDAVLRFDQRLTTIESELNALGARRATLEKQLAERRASAAQAEVRQREAFATLSRRVRALWRLPLGSRLALLGGSTSLGELLATARLLRSVSLHDRRLHERQRQLQAELQIERDALAAKVAELDAATASAKRHRDELAEQRAGRVALVEAALADSGSRQRLAQERQGAAKNLLAMLTRLQPTGRLAQQFSKNRGRLPWPAAGAPGLRFGQEVDPASGTQVTHNGLDIRAPSGSEVRAVADGEVVFADWLHGYGQLVIVDHGDDHVTLYAHLGSMAVTPNSAVRVGDLLGTVGETGSMRGALLYFEVRARGVAQDPEGWLRR